MKLSKESIINLAMVLLMLIVILLIIWTSHKNSRLVETRIDTLSLQIQRMNNLTRSVEENLQQTIRLMATVSTNLESSSKQLEDLLKEAGSISSGQKQRIKNALSDIEHTRISVEEEKQKALKLISEINATGNDPE